MKIRQEYILLLAALSLTACRSGVIFEQTVELPIDGWSQENLVSFTIPVEDTINQYEISLIIRNDARYGFSNLFLFINTTAPGGQGIRDTVEVMLADESGRWFGKGIGGKYTLKLPFKTQVVFPQSGNYIIEIEQGMRDDDLEYITDVGVSVRKLK